MAEAPTDIPFDPLGFVEVFYIDTWVDPQAAANPRFGARGKVTKGPFHTCPEAVSYPALYRSETTHFTVRKEYVKGGLVRWFNPVDPAFTHNTIETIRQEMRNIGQEKEG